jgi:solute carrier family 25 S-adenosylmethionine transporter 26
MESALAGALAGLSVDVSLYPIDTVKTRMQSKNGFIASGAFKGVYKGLSVVTVTSVPSGALFFSGYDAAKSYRKKQKKDSVGELSVADLTGAAWVGETLACLVRVPSDMVKQRMQTQRQECLAAGSGSRSGSLRAAVKGILDENNGSLLAFYRGMPITLCRDLPFVAVQMTLYETLKDRLATSSPGCVAGLPQPFLGLCSGAAAGGTAALVTTPLDVARTRVNLGQSSSASVLATLQEVAREGGVRSLFRGASTRVMWISAGGSVFFATYETVKCFITS